MAQKLPDDIFSSLRVRNPALGSVGPIDYAFLKKTFKKSKKCGGKKNKPKKLLACIVEKFKEAPTAELSLMREAAGVPSQIQALVDEILI